jgi:predicted deacylase
MLKSFAGGGKSTQCADTTKTMTIPRRHPAFSRLRAGLFLAIVAGMASAGDHTRSADPVGQPDIALADAVQTVSGSAAEPLALLGSNIAAGTTQRLSWIATELFEGVPVSTPVFVVNGGQPGPTLCLTAAIHGDELNGIEMVRRIMHDIGRDLNRYFPGNPNGSSAARIAHSFFQNVVTHCDALIDLHTGSFERANLPQIRADLRDPDVLTLAQGFGATVILHSTPGVGTLRHAATQAGIPSVTLEAGGPLELELNEVKHGVKGIETLIASLGMMHKRRFWGDPEPVYYRSTWVRAESGGILFSDVSLGSSVRKGDLLGTITDPMSNVRVELRAPYSGRIIGMSRNQVVMPGFAAFHVGIQTDAAPEESTDDALAKDKAAAGENKTYIDGISEE